MILEWEITRTDQPGGAWMSTRRVVIEQVHGDPEQPDTMTVVRTVQSIRREAYTTLTNVRRAVAAELRLDKRVRFRKESDTEYTYTYKPETFGGES